MSVGAFICALGLAALAASQGPVSYLASWMVIGIGHAMTLANVGNVTIAQLMGDKTRRVIGLMMVVGGLGKTWGPLLGGAAFLIATDTFARTAGGGDNIPIGVVTAFFGAREFGGCRRKKWRS